MTLRLMQPYVTDAMRAAVQDTLNTTWIGQGPKVDEFERCFQQLTAMESVAVGSGTDALHLAYILAGIEPGDEVICPVFTCTATNIPLRYLQAEIKFADVQRDSLNMDPNSVARLFNKNTKAIVVVHYGGEPAHVYYPYGVPVIEDCAQALGAPVGTSTYNAYSFQAVKHVTTGDGGMLTMASVSRAEKARRLRWFGIDRKAKLGGMWANDISEVGFKYQMTDIAASMGIASLGSLELQIAYRRFLRDTYLENLEWRILDLHPDSACWLMTVLAPDRERTIAKLAEKNIEAAPAHYRNDRYTIFRGYENHCPNMDAIENYYLCLPLHMGMTENDVLRVCEALT